MFEDKIELIKILDWLCISILVPSVPPTVLKTGGTYIHLGLLMSMSAVARMLSASIFGELLKLYGRKQLLKYSVAASLVLNAALLLTYSVPALLLNRIIYIFVNQAPMLCAELSTQNKEQALHKNPQAQRIAATLVGCGVVGSLIDAKGGFYVLALFATIISLIEIALLLQMESSSDKEEKKIILSEAATVFPKTYKNILKVIRDTDIHFANWDALLIKSLLVSNSTVVFILYVVMVILVFQGNGSWVCTTSAYQTIMIFIAAFSFEKFKILLKDVGTPKDILEKSSLVCSVCAFILALSPSYKFYLFMFIPFLISRTVVENFYVEVYDVKKNQKLGEDLKTVVAVTEIVGPLLIGFLFYMLTYNAYRLLAVAPIIGVYFIVKRRTFKTIPAEKDLKTENAEKEVKKNKDE